MKIGKWKRRLLKLVIVEVFAVAVVCLVLATGCITPRLPFSGYPRYSDLELHGKVGRTCMVVGDVVGVAADIVCLPATLAVDACLVVSHWKDTGGEDRLGLMFGCMFIPLIPGNLIAEGAYYAGAGLTYPVYLAAVKIPRAIRLKTASDESVTTYLISRLPRVSASEYDKLVSASGRTVHVPPAREATGPLREGLLEFRFGSRPFQFLSCVPEDWWRAEGAGEWPVDGRGWPMRGEAVIGAEGRPIGVVGYLIEEWKAWDKAGRPRGGPDEVAHVLDSWVMTHDMPELLGTDKLEQLLKVSKATVSRYFLETAGTGNIWRFWMEHHGGARQAVRLTPDAIAEEMRRFPQWPFGDEEARRRQQQAAEELSVPAETALDLGGGVTMKFALIPLGSFMMGGRSGRTSAKRVRWVRITKPFYMGVTEVTQEQWRAVMGTEPWSKLDGRGRPMFGVGKSKDAPAQYLSWTEASAFCKRLSGSTGCQVRLPTEAEWECACRAGSDAAYCFGSSRTELSDYAWFGGLDHSQPWGYCPQPVAQKKPNAWGLYDMHGNVWEWCQDFDDRHYDRAESPAVDPTGPATDVFGERVMRGGSWGSNADDCGSANRNGLSAQESSDHYGLRAVMEVAIPLRPPVGPALGEAAVPAGERVQPVHMSPAAAR
jgi:formylglycine-generating enzyme required for sulfatase activity